MGEAPQLKGEILKTINKPSFFWEQFVQMGSSHLVLPSLYIKLRDADLLSQLPRELVVHLEEIHLLNLNRNRHYLLQVKGLLALFQKEGIHTVLMKGAGALVEELYTDPGERVVSDIDCLVSESDFLRAVEVLKAEGYDSPPFHPASLPMMHHYPSLYKAGEAAKIEIHRFPVGRRQLKYLEMDRLNKQFFHSKNPQVSFTFDRDHQILLNVIHNQLKDKGQYYANIPLRNIYEFYRLTLEHKLSTPELHHPRMKRVMERYVAVANLLFSPAFAIPVSTSTGTKLFLFRFHLNKSSRAYAHGSRMIRSMAELILSYLRIIFRALVRKEVRIYLRARLSNPRWYRHHVRVLRNRFSR